MILSDVVNVRKKRDRKTRVGRGSGSGLGKTCGKGHRGAKCRAGWGGLTGYEGGQMPLFRSIPRRGFNNKRFQIPVASINLRDLDAFDDGAEITPENLREAGLVPRQSKLVKILGHGTLEKRFAIKANRFSRSAVQKIQAAGGTAEIIK